MNFIKHKFRFEFFHTMVLMAGMMLAVLFMSGRALAADEVTTRALKLYEKHHYEDAFRLLRTEWAKMDGNRQSAASLALGMIHLGNARLYRELHQTGQAIELDYLMQLRRQKTEASSRYLNLYLGQTFLQAGKIADAVKYLRRFADKAPAKSAMKPYADIELGIAYSLQKNTQNALQLWNNVDTRKPEIKAALAGAYAVTDAQGKKPLLMAEAALMDAKKQNYIPSPRMNRNLLRAYSQAGAPAKAIELLDANEFKEASFVEDLGTSKSINFYDLSLLDDMAVSHLNAAVMYLEKASLDTRLAPSVTFYLAEAYLLQGNAAKALYAAASFLAQPQIPLQYENMTRVQQAIAFAKTGQKKESAVIWQSLADKAARDPDLLTSLMQACAPANADCVKIEKMALTAVETGDGKKFFPLNSALGKYYLIQKDYPKAVFYMEAGRDKAYKNKIEVNDPAMLTALAEAYYRTKKFSESLEIYFEIGKQFPAVRQIQEAMQGIYAMEHQSAGDVKIF